MKKSLLALAVLSVFAGAASAQSSVTLSGGVDLGVQRINGQWSMATAGSGRSFFTLSGTEDLGGGMRAIFLLQHRFAPNTGSVNVLGNCVAAATPAANCLVTNQTYFFRNSWVGLAGGFGDVRLGRILMPLQDFNGGYDPFGTDTVGSTHTGGINATIRATNAIYYRSPSMGGLQLHAAIAAAEGQIAAEQGGLAGKPYNRERPLGLGIVYAAGPLRVAVALDKNSADQKTTGLYGSYNLGVATLMGQFEKGDTNITNASLVNRRVDRWSLGATVPMGAATIKAGYTRWSDEDIKKLGLGVNYDLSKRTQLYADLGKLSGNGSATLPLTALNRKARFDVGIFHRF